MKISVYAIRDTLIGYGMPVIRDNDAVAVRSFKYDLNLDNSPYSADPHNFQLFRLGEYDTDTGIITGCDPLLVVNAVDLIEEKEK